MGRYVVVVLGVLLAALPVLPSHAHAHAAPYVKYYTVESAYAGKAESLRDIAERFLGNRDRAEEIFNLNVGREQPGGGALTDPATLRAGWRLVLPWDAVGAGAGQFVGSGTQYAVAYVAGQVALVRSAFPNLSASQVADRIRTTANKTTDTADPATYGSGVIDPFTSVNAVLDNEAPAAASSGPPASGDGTSSTSGGRLAILVLIGLVLLVVTVLAVFRLRTVLRSDPAPDPDPEFDLPANRPPDASDPQRMR
ncbi:S8 family serine peptidase [Phytohabitans kaempferiae]|uniref:S8 family serine peptidase n=1 Tax=Phytohabitans kaempferiae TaxID=1620943 RepID=A0ABV6LY35_9ACTN